MGYEIGGGDSVCRIGPGVRSVCSIPVEGALSYAVALRFVFRNTDSDTEAISIGNV